MTYFIVYVIIALLIFTPIASAVWLTGQEEIETRHGHIRKNKYDGLEPMFVFGIMFWPVTTVVVPTGLFFIWWVPWSGRKLRELVTHMRGEKNEDQS